MAHKKMPKGISQSTVMHLEQSEHTLTEKQTSYYLISDLLQHTFNTICHTRHNNGIIRIKSSYKHL